MSRWNSTYQQLKSIVRCENALFTWQRDKQFGTPRKVHLNQGDFDLAQDLVQVLEPIFEFTLQLLIQSSARVAKVVIMIDQITGNLSTLIANEDGRYPPALRNACRAGIRLANKYCSPIYQIAMVLHPLFKDEYFKLAQWPQSWIDKAINLTRDMFNTNYKAKQPTSSQTSVKQGPAKPQTGVLAGLGAAAAARSAEVISDPVDIWLAGGLVLDRNSSPVNGLKWWGKQKQSGNNHHGLLQMVLDVLGCPATSVNVERSFNFGRDYVSARRHNLDAKSVSRGMALLFYLKNGKIKPLNLHEYMEKRKDDMKSKAKQKAAVVQGVLTVE
ncbi:hypothetical protein PSTG_06347 [Puccinia striiformis f. sp. tritici PST-78]|uniref:HAT C-terminal dimerisation domain-containing protein n=1 Tax=Puccinia striiformis f. sp. tritici PST-78 TaxID=1165861 RepID=A0A0L0VMB2_9BASI|nr:hypothetical protein PSTG_06347 [Puccinia striiformis f. sp. tritici PST-78]